MRKIKIFFGRFLYDRADLKVIIIILSVIFGVSFFIYGFNGHAIISHIFGALCVIVFYCLVNSFNWMHDLPECILTKAKEILGKNPGFSELKVCIEIAEKTGEINTLKVWLDLFAEYERLDSLREHNGSGVRKKELKGVLGIA